MDQVAPLESVECAHLILGRAHSACNQGDHQHAIAPLESVECAHLAALVVRWLWRERGLHVPDAGGHQKVIRRSSEVLRGPQRSSDGPQIVIRGQSKAIDVLRIPIKEPSRVAHAPLVRRPARPPAVELERTRTRARRAQVALLVASALPATQLLRCDGHCRARCGGRCGGRCSGGRRGGLV